MSRQGSSAGLTSVVESVGGDGTGDRRRALVGGDHVGRTIASHPSEDHDVVFLGRNSHAVDRVTRDDATAHHVEEIDSTALDQAGSADVSLAVVASGDDVNSFLVVQLLRTRFGVENIVVRVDSCEKLDSFDDPEVETVCVADLLVDDVVDRFVDDVVDRLETETNYVEDA